MNDYWNGTTNKIVRFYFYIQRGLLFLNEFRYLIMAILAIYALLKMDNPWMMLLMFVVAIPVLTILGWIYTHKMAKVMDFLNVQYSTHWTRYSFELQEKQVELLKRVADGVDKRDPDHDAVQ